jgi:hypothetical protein
MNSSAPTHHIRFNDFYREHFLPEHHHPLNVGLHVFGTVVAWVFVGWALLSPWPWLALLFPVVHAAPGLVGHRWVERNEAVGDLRVLRRDFPPLWFIAANHRLTWELLRGGVRRSAG